MTTPKTPTKGRQTRTPPVAVSQVRPADFTAQRERLGLTQHHLAKMFGYTRQQIGNYESGRQPVPAIVALAMKGVQADAGNAASDRALQRALARTGGKMVDLVRRLAKPLAQVVAQTAFFNVDWEKEIQRHLFEAANLLDDAELIEDGVRLSPFAAHLTYIEGWDLFWNEEQQRLEIQADIELNILPDDAAALEYVRRRAAEGSKLHRLALAIHDRPGWLE